MSAELERRVTELEILLEQERHTVRELNAALLDQGRQIEELRRDLEAIRASGSGADALDRPDPGDEPPPPHY